MNVKFAHTGSDFRIMGGTAPLEITFGPMEMSKEFNVTTLHDIVGEGDETIVLSVMALDSENTINVESIQNQTKITIIEDDSECSVLSSFLYIIVHTCIDLVEHWPET